MIYTVTFNPSLDYVIQVDDLTLGRVNRTTKEAIFPGGKGVNVSVILSNLGIKSKALGFIAGFTGKQLEKMLTDFGCYTDFIELKEGLTRINVKVNSNEESEINGQGPDISDAAIAELFEKLDCLKNGDILVLAGSIPNTLPEDIYESIMERLQTKGVRIVVDATKDLLLNVLKYHPFLIKPNLAELRQLVANPQAPISDQIEELRDQGAGHILVSMGAEGSVLFAAGGGVYRQLPLAGPTVSTVGAGDSMVAGFLAALENPACMLEDSLRWAAACGTATAFSRGIARRERVEALRDQIQIEF